MKEKIAFFRIFLGFLLFASVFSVSGAAFGAGLPSLNGYSGYSGSFSDDSSAKSDGTNALPLLSFPTAPTGYQPPATCATCHLGGGPVSSPISGGGTGISGAAGGIDFPGLAGGLASGLLTGVLGKTVKGPLGQLLGQIIGPAIGKFISDGLGGAAGGIAGAAGGGAGGAGTNPFGGMIATAIPCAPGIWFQVVGAKGGNFIWGPGSQTYMSGPPRPGVNTVGLAGPDSVCTVGDDVKHGKFVIMIGTSGGGASVPSGAPKPANPPGTPAPTTPPDPNLPPPGTYNGITLSTASGLRGPLTNAAALDSGTIDPNGIVSQGFSQINNAGLFSKLGTINSVFGNPNFISALEIQAPHVYNRLIGAGVISGTPIPGIPTRY